jgi:hypothetical protein
MFADASGNGVSENEFEFRLEQTESPGTLIPLDDETSLFKMAFIDFDRDRRGSVKESFCVNSDQFHDRTPHPSGDDRFFLPGTGQIDGDDLDVKIENESCEGVAKKKSIRVTGTRVGFLCDNPEHASFDDFYATSAPGKGDPDSGNNVVFCHDCFSGRNPYGKCHGPHRWEPKSDGGFEEILEKDGKSEVGKAWPYFTGRPKPADFDKCNRCEPQCFSVEKCKQKFHRVYNNPYVEPWKRSIQLSFKEPTFKVKYRVTCTNKGKHGKLYKNDKDETCDRNFQFGLTYWKKICSNRPTKPATQPSTPPKPFTISTECEKLNIGAKSCRKCEAIEIGNVVAQTTPQCAATLLSEFKKDRSTTSVSTGAAAKYHKRSQTKFDLEAMKLVCPCLLDADPKERNYCNPEKGFPPLRALYVDCTQFEF